ncbi:MULTISPECIES: sensor histidine kinase [Bacillus]|uniref:sensor histidine kinase n=1 Tax=Bacillus TaxID=1386 RepID=UPI000D202BC6|nr:MULTISPECIES: HAMP domain-containing sensor histidine kinase [Bacillus]AVI39876.1 sensor histidine kinase [Bacillus pumilus]MBU8726312.1 HAMP domain-containing histidine kinase [Bacillus pumilus]MCP1147193.1 HAMP domain-containing histidine kinase [Bacillus sp. 1735sda2]QHQ75651.1 HAMP domain-containing protein [Bacillus pumilus]
MKIKYFYQLLMSHLGLLLIAIIIISTLMSHFVKDIAYQNKVDEMKSYGNEILRNFQQLPKAEMNFRLRPFEDILSTRQIRFFVFDEKGNVLTQQQEMPPHEALLTKDLWTKLAKGEDIIVKRSDSRRLDQEASLVALPVIEDGKLKGGVVLIAPIQGAEELIAQMNRYLYIIVFVALTITFILSLFLSKFHVNRIKKLREATEKIAHGDYNIHLENKHLDEIGTLGEDFNMMANRLQRSREEIDRLEKRRRQFIADVSHELKTPLTTIRGLVEWLNTADVPAEEKEKCYALITDETKRMLRLVNENMDYEKIRSNQITLQKFHYPLIDTFEVIKEQLNRMAEEKNNQLIVEVNPDQKVYADYDRLIQILVNITKNAIQFTEGGRIVLRGKEEDGETIIEVEDTGVGIAPEEVKHIWERFYKADISRTTTPYGEYGLGLSIVKQLVDLHEGQIDLKSEKYKGTTFTIRLPLSQQKG